MGWLRPRFSGSGTAGTGYDLEHADEDKFRRRLERVAQRIELEV